MNKIAYVMATGPGKFIVGFTDRDGPFVAATLHDLNRLASQGYVVKGAGFTESSQEGSSRLSPRGKQIGTKL